MSRQWRRGPAGLPAAAVAVLVALATAPALGVAAPPDDPAAAARSLQEEARRLAAQDLAPRAAATFAAALERASAAGDPGLVATLLLELAEQQIALAYFPEAASGLDRAARLMVGDAASPELAFKLANARGTLATYRRDMAAAIGHRRDAVARARELDDSARLATALANLAGTLIQVHQYAEALVALDEALPLAPADSRQRAIALANLGICQYELNQMEEAAARFAETRELAARLGNALLESWAEGELGLVAWTARRDDDDALAHFQRAIDLARRAGDRRNEAVWWGNMGRVRRDQQRWQEAIPLYRRAIALREEIGIPEPNFYKHLGQCEAGLGRDDEAATLFDRALTLAAERDDGKVVWETQRERARLLLRRGDADAADAAYAAALDAIEAIRGSLALPAFKTDFFEDKVEVYAEYAAFLAVERHEPGRAFEVAERARARAFLDVLAESQARIDSALPSSVTADERRLRDALSRAAAEIRAEGATPERSATLAATEGALERFQLQVRLAHPGFHGLRYPQATPLAEVQAALRPGEALLAFFLGADSSHRWLVWPGSLEYRLLPGRREVEGAVRSAYAAFAHPQGTAEEPARLSALLLAGLDPSRLPRRLLLVPDGAMFYLPFEALPLADGRLMGDLVATSYLPAAALALGAGRGAAPAPRLLALGGAEYGGGSGDGTSRAAALEQLRHLPPLPHSEREARRVAALWGEDDATVLTGAAASEAQLRAMALGDYSVLHLASHGWLDPVSSARSGLVLAPGDAAHDGLLQVREILELPLAAELVTLSACGSALGELVTGEGMVGVTRAFLHAGADAVVASLWNVDDESAAAFMAAFYGALRQGVPRGEALQRARAALRADARWRHPYHWAAWVLVGRGDTGVAFPPRRGLPAWAWAVAAALAAIALGGAAWARGRRRREASPGPPST